MKRLILNATLFGILLSSTNVWAASDITGKVHTINVNRTWGGVFIQLDNADVFESGSACQSLWAFVPIVDDYTKHFVAVAMSAKATGEPVRIATSGCVPTPMGPVPKIEWIDHGLRK